MKAVVMAGGFGSRISQLYPDIPKPLIPIMGIPVLERTIARLSENGIDEILITVYHKADQIIDYFGDGSKISKATGKPFGVKIKYFREEKPMGSAGALMHLKSELSSPFLLINGDLIFDIDINRMLRFHNSHPGKVSILVHPNDHPYDSGLVFTNEDGRVIQWLSKEDKRPENYHNIVNAGIQIVDPEILNLWEGNADLLGKEMPNGKPLKLDLDKDIFKPLIQRGEIYAYLSPEYVKDMGTPERFEKVSKDIRDGIVEKKKLSNSQKAFFLDRDGTINTHVGFLSNIDDFSLIEGVTEAIKLIHENGYLAIVVTNQPVIARGELSISGLEEIHKKMERLLGEKEAYIDGIYYCPHHPDSGFAGEVKALKIKCSCRKPLPGLLQQAARDFNIDLRQSYMIGDSESDLAAGIAAGCKSFKIEENKPNALLNEVKKIFSSLKKTKSE